jgi:hypothetical protein
MNDIQKLHRKAVEDSDQQMIKVGDTVRHNIYGRDALVTATYTAVQNGARWNQIDIDQPGGPWDPKHVRKI